MRHRILTGSLLIATLLTGIFFYQRYHIPPQVDIPAITVTDLNGRTVSFTEYSGHPLFISFFATWCGPCMRELPQLAVLHDRLSSQQLTVVCISDDPVEKLKQLDALYGSRLIFLHTESLHDIGIYTYPTNYIFNGAGRKVYSQVNAEEWSDAVVVQRVKELLSR